MLADQIMLQHQGFGQVSVPTPTAMIIKQASMSPNPTRRMQPSPTPSRRSAIMPSPQIMCQPSAISSAGDSPVFPQRHTLTSEASMRRTTQRPPSVISRQFSPPSSPIVSHFTNPRMHPQRSPSPLTRGGTSPSRSPHASMIRRSYPNSPRASGRQHSPPSSPRASIRRQSPPSSVTSIRSPFGGNPQSSSPLPAGHMSRPLSLELNRRQSHSPSPSHRSMSPTGTRPSPSSPTLSRRSTRLLRDPTPLSRPRMGGNIPLGTVRPSPMGLRGRPVPPPTQNVRPFRPSSIRSNRSSVLTVDTLHSSPFHSPELVRRTPLGRKESGRFPPRPVGRGHPLMAQQSLRRKSPTSPQLSLKHMSRPTSPHFSPQFSLPPSPLLPHQATHPPVITDPYSEPLHQSFPPSSPTPFTPGLSPEQIQAAGMNEIGTEYGAPHSPSSPSISVPMQNQAIRDAPYAGSLPGPVSLHQQSMPPTYPVLSGALQNQAVRGASYVSPLPRPQSTYAPSVPSSPLLSGAMSYGTALRGVSSFPTPQLYSPYGPTVVTPYDHISEPGPAPLLHDALHNRSSLQNFSALRSPLMHRHNPYAPAGPQVHSALQKNPNLRFASYQTPIQVIRSPYGQQPPSSPTLGRAMQNQQIMQASYQLPDGTLGSPYVDSSTSPVLTHALQNQQIRGASYILPDGSIVRVCMNKEPNLKIIKKS